MQAMTVTAGSLAAASANNIHLASTPTAGSVTLDGALVSNGVALLGAPRRVLVTTLANETTASNTMTITGVGANNSVISETVTLPNASTVYTSQDFLTVTSLSVSKNAAGNITVGTNTIGGSPWVRFDDFAPSNISIQCTVSGTVNYTVQSTLDDPNDPFSSVSAVNITWVDRKSTRLNSSHIPLSRMPSSA